MGTTTGDTQGDTRSLDIGSSESSEQRLLQELRLARPPSMLAL